MKKIQFFLTAAAILFTQVLQAQSLDPVILDKTATGPNDDGTYTLTLKSYVTGETMPVSKMAPADIIFTMDLSGSMKNNIGKDDVYTEKTKKITASIKAVKETTKTMTATAKDAFKAVNQLGTVAKTTMKATDRTTSSTKNWTHKAVTANTTGTADYSHFYKDENGDYYAVRKWEKLLNSDTGKENVYAIGYQDKNGNTWYLTSTGKSATYENVTSNTATLWNGTLYKGWAYRYHRTGNSTDGYTYQCYGFDNGNEDATVASQWYYLHTDGEYYPVRRSATLSDGNGNNDVYGAWVEINGVKWYLHGDKLDTDYDKTMKSQYRAIWFGAPLYKGGWTYTTIKVFNASGAHYYQYTDGKRYPVQKATEEVGGVTTYQAFVEIPGVGKRYLYGTNSLSETPCPFSTANDIPMYFGELYTGGWTTANITDGTTGTSHYYLHTDGEYYPVRKSTTADNHQVYVELPEGTRYFDGNGLSTEPYPLSPTNKYVAFYFGTLYTVTGWTSATIKTATAEGGHFYLHSDGHYYPVLKETLTSPTTTYQAYVMLPGSDGNLTVKKYLWGHELHDEPCPYSAATTTVFYYGTLYTGGWTQATFTVASSDAGGHLYLHTDGEYYPVQKETKTVNVDGVDKTTYQVYVVLPEGKRYVWGYGVHEDPYPYSWATKASLYFGPLYSGGFNYSHHITTKSAGGEFYKHTDGKYYRVLGQTGVVVNGNSTWQLYVLLPDAEGNETVKKYLWGHGLHDDPYPFSVQKTVGIYFGELYQGGWAYADITAGSATGGHYILYEGEYYPVKKKSMTVSDNSTRQAYVNLPDPDNTGETITWYLTPTGLSQSPYTWSRNTDGKSTIWFGSLYLLKQYDYSRYEGLRRAVYSFVEELAAMSVANGVHNRVALTQYATHGWAYKPNNSNTANNLALPHLKQFTNADADGNSAVLCDFKDLTEPDQVEALKAALPEGTPTTGGTSGRWGMSLARGLFLREGGSEIDYDGNGSVDGYEKRVFAGDPYAPDEDGIVRKKILISIGDGEDYDTGALNRTLWKNYANNVFKVDVPDAKVFVVHVQTTAIHADEKAIASPDETREDGSVFHYYYDVRYYDESLIEALLGITSEISGAAVELGEQAVVHDVVKPEFQIPAGARIQIFTANCTGFDDVNNVLLFEDEDSWESFDGSYERIDNPDKTTTINVTGFDFSANWCGPHGTGEDAVYSGKQLIVQFPIIANEGIVGGVLPTNDPNSAIWDDEGKPLEEYPIPYVGPFPIHIQISKTGMKAGDSAVFQIWRKAKEASSFDKTGDPYMKVVLTGSDDGSAVLADIVDLDPNFDYLVEETGWSWKYTPGTTAISTVEQKVNPFEFSNTPKTVTTKSAEDHKENKFF